MTSCLRRCSLTYWRATMTTEIYDKQAEAVVLGSIIGNRQAMEQVRDIISDDCFYVGIHRTIYGIIRDADSKGEPFDMLSVKARLDRTGTEYDLPYLMKMTGSFAPDVLPFALRLDDLRKRRSLWVLGSQLTADAVMETSDIDEVIDKAGHTLADMGLKGQSQFRQLGEVIYELREQVKRNMAGDAARRGTPTGFSDFDRMGGGFQQGDLVIIAGETSQGKTSLATCMAENAAKSGAGVAFYSLEMTAQQLAARLVAIESGVSSSDIIYKALDGTRWAAFDSGVAKLLDLPIYIDETATSNLSGILASIRSMVKRYGIKGAVVDYLQILSVNNRGGDNAEQLMGNAARELKNIAKDLGIWVVALSQLSRDKEHPEPSLARLRQSGQIAEAADVVMLVYRPEVYGRTYTGEWKDTPVKGTALIDVAKGRNIGLKRFITSFDAPTTRFFEYEQTETKVEPIKTPF